MKWTSAKEFSIWIKRYSILRLTRATDHKINMLAVETYMYMYM